MATGSRMQRRHVWLRPRSDPPGTRGPRRPRYRPSAPRPLEKPAAGARRRAKCPERARNTSFGRFGKGVNSTLYFPALTGRALGRYELLRPLARGGMGEVYLARRRAAGVEKVLVVKRMRPERAGDVRFLDLFKREAKLSMSLAHQNIVPVFDFGRIDDQVFLAMERVEGKDLGSTLTRAGKPLPTLLAAFIAAECLQALDYAHRRKGPDGTDLGIVHRD